MATVSIANTTANISGKTVILAERDHTITGAWTFSRSPSAPFVVTAASAVVTNLDADKLDGQHGPTGAIVGITDAQVLTNKTLGSPTVTGVILGDRGAVGAPAFSYTLDPDTGVWSSGANALELSTAGVKALGVDSTQFIDSPTQPRCSVFHSATQTIATGTQTALLFNSEDFDVGTMHDTVTNNSRVTIPTGGDGLYLIMGATPTDGAVASGNFYIGKNGTVTIGTPFFTGQQVPLRAFALMSLVAADYIELIVIQNAATSTVYGSASAATAARLHVVKLW